MSMKRVELVYFSGCPNVDTARRNIREAVGQAGGARTWQEWDVLADGTPNEYQAFPSPTVLVDGRDVMGVSVSGGVACRAEGAPTESQILTALLEER